MRDGGKEGQRAPAEKPRRKSKPPADAAVPDSFSREDVFSIERTIQWMQHGQAYQQECGWVSPLHPSPAKSRIKARVDASPVRNFVLSAPSSSSGAPAVPNASAAQESYRNNTSVMSVNAEVLSSSAPSTTFSSLRYQEKMAKYKHLLSNAGDTSTVPAPLGSILNNSLSTPLKPGRPQQLPIFADSPDKENTANYSFLFETSVSADPPRPPPLVSKLAAEDDVVVPLHILDKLRLAEQEYEVALAKERRAVITQLKAQLSEGSAAYMQEVKTKAERQAKVDRREVLRAIEQHMWQLVDTHFADALDDPAAHADASTAKVPPALRALLENLVKKTKAAKQEEVSTELRQKVLQASQRFQSQQVASQRLSQEEASKRAYDEHVLKEFRAIADQIHAASASQLRSAVAPDSGFMTQQASERYSLARAIEKARILQLKLHRSLSHEVEGLRTKITQT